MTWRSSLTGFRSCGHAAFNLVPRVLDFNGGLPEEPALRGGRGMRGHREAVDDRVLTGHLRGTGKDRRALRRITRKLHDRAVAGVHPKIALKQILAFMPRYDRESEASAAPHNFAALDVHRVIGRVDQSCRAVGWL